jgi:polyribonucleotide nucleotidyltransferase
LPLAPEGAEPKFPPGEIGEAFHKAQAKVVRWNILEHKRRIDGRDLITVRQILASALEAFEDEGLVRFDAPA